MDKKWCEMDILDKKQFWQDTNKMYSNLRDVAYEAFTRKSKLLTAGNAGGILIVVTYFGAVTKDIDKYIVISLFLFF